MGDWICVWPREKEIDNPRLERAVLPLLQKHKVNALHTAREAEAFFAARARDGKKKEPLCVLFVTDLGDDGVNLEEEALIRLLRKGLGLAGCVGGVVVDCDSALYTKSAATRLVQAANAAGCRFPGGCLVEATQDLLNFTVRARNAGSTREEAYAESVRLLWARIEETAFPGAAAAENSVLSGAAAAENSVLSGDAAAENSALSGAAASETSAPATSAMTQAPRPFRVLALHASSHETSNTYALWSRIRESLHAQAKERGLALSTQEIGLRNGTLLDCSGCPYQMCLHYGEQAGCFYGGVMVEEVYPALQQADALVLVCPNYNDALSANLVAFINRLSALYRVEPFYEKTLFAVVVAGYSGADILSRQLIAALNMNKGFCLPPSFAMMERAAAPGEALRLPGIEKRCEIFAKQILEERRNKIEEEC